MVKVNIESESEYICSSELGFGPKKLWKVNAKVKVNEKVAIRRHWKWEWIDLFLWGLETKRNNRKWMKSSNMKSLKVRMNIFVSLRLRGKKK